MRLASLASEPLLPSAFSVLLERKEHMTVIPARGAMAACIFCDIVANRSPASVGYRDDDCMVVMDICPINTGHLLVIPVRHATQMLLRDGWVWSALKAAIVS